VTLADPPSQRVVVFVGAGLSAAAGLPLFDELRAALFHDVLAWRWITRQTRAQLTEALTLLAPEYAVSLIDRDGESPREYICDRLSVGRPAVEHRLVAMAAAAGAHVYTPNFDQLIELAGAGPTRVAVRRRVDDPVPDAELFKLHGSCPDIVVTAEEVLLSTSGPWADAFLNDCARAETHLLVWGYKGVDPDLAPLVQRGAEAAPRCTWIAFNDDDRVRALSLLANASAARVEFVNGDFAQARSVAQTILDPDRAVSVADCELRPPERISYPYSLRLASTRASALAHLGSARLGRRAWLAVALRGDRGAIQRTVRSLLFDSSVAQAVTLSAVPALLRHRPSVGGIRALLTAAEGHGVRENSDRLIDLVWPLAESHLRPVDGVEVRARIATLMRSRGRLADASVVLRAVAGDLRANRMTADATWTGRLAYEGCIVRRLAGEIPAAQQVLDSINTSDTAIVGTNWSMWLEDERCAISLVSENALAARRHLERARALSKAYGQHRLALADLAIRELQLDVLLGAELRDIVQGAQDCWRQARRAGVLTPLRRAWIEGVVADCARRAGDNGVANAKHTMLLRSPHLLHRLAAAVGLLLNGKDPEVDVDVLERATGRTVIGQTLQALVHPNRPHTHETDEVLGGLRDGRLFLYLS
jgi:hypothetical protein